MYTEITPEVFIANISPGKKVTVMNVRDFYNCLTPGSKVRAKGRGNFINLREEDLGPEIYRIERLPLPDDSFLNSICREGLLTYTDFYFLLNVVATPRRCMDVFFHTFDVNANDWLDAAVKNL